MDLNDLPLCARYGQPPRTMIDMFDDTKRALRDRESRSLMVDVTAHAHVFGRAAGAWVCETIIERAKAMPDVWIATRQEIARHVLACVWRFSRKPCQSRT